MKEEKDKIQIDEAATSQENTKKKGRFIPLIVILIILLVLCGGYLGLCLKVQDNVIWSDASINGVSIQGMTVSDAKAAVLADFEEKYSDAAIYIELDDEVYTIEVFSLLELDASNEINAAYEYGHNFWLYSGWEWIQQHYLGKSDQSSADISPAVSEAADASALVAATGISEYSSLVEGSWELTDTSLVIHKGATGKVADEEQLAALVEEALYALEFPATIECPYTTEEPAEPDFEEIAESVYVEAVSATLDPDNDYEIVESIEGVSLDAESALEEFSSADEDSDITIDLTFTEPEITTEDMEENLFADLLGTYQSTVSGDSNKLTNISLAVGFCDGVILMPGETFSYNDTIGDTTEERGYKTANVYLNGSVEKETGGGVCQVSSTIFSALLQTDIEITQRQCHSMIVSYVPYGMDATVYAPYLDFQFTNNHAYPIKLSLTLVNSVITVKIWGTQESDLTVKSYVEKTGTLAYTPYRYYYDSDGNLVATEYIGKSKYKKVS